MNDGKRNKVLLLELNEITWTLIEPMLARGQLPNLARLRRDGAWGAPRSVDLPPHLDPWITWVTVHTGVPRAVHGASVLEQDAATIRTPRTWDHAVAAGRSIGVFGSISAYPPRPVPGFMVPGPFAPGPETFPPYLEPVQRVNRMQVRIHNRIEPESRLRSMARDGLGLLALGLTPRTLVRAGLQLARERLVPHRRWRRVALQPLVNFDVFARLYRRYRPDYATWHTNHVAHYMHHYWRAHDDSGFLAPASPEEKRRFGAAVEYGYRIADELIGRALRLVDRDTVLVVASSMGQKPYVSEEYRAGRLGVSFRSLDRVLEIIGASGVVRSYPVMAPQWNLVIPDAAERARVRTALLRAHREGGPGETREAFAVTETGDILTVNPKGLAQRHPALRYFFPGSPGAAAEGYAFADLFDIQAPTAKEGMHDPVGTLLLWGPGIRAGLELRDTSNLDIAPTLLALLGVPVPSFMQGRVLAEAWGGRPANAPAPVRQRPSSEGPAIGTSPGG
jgi:hypothetical protein